MKPEASLCCFFGNVWNIRPLPKINQVTVIYFLIINKHSPHLWLQSHVLILFLKENPVRRVSASGPPNLGSTQA